MHRALLFAAVVLSFPAQAYVILESKYRVEVAPGVFEDQLVLKCDNGRQITVPWEARLSEACGEVDIPRTAAPAQPAAASQERQKEIQKARMREQFGDIDERHVTVESGLEGGDAHFSPQMREILKRYELCRKNTKGSQTCAAERDQAMAALSSRPAASEPQQQPAEPRPAPDPKAAVKPAASPAASAETESTRPTPAAEPAYAVAPPAAPPAKPAPQTPEPAADRVAREQKIAEDYAWCMRAKPRFVCDTERADALKALDAPAKPKVKNKAAKGSRSPEVAAN